MLFNTMIQYNIIGEKRISLSFLSPYFLPNQTHSYERNGKIIAEFCFTIGFHKQHCFIFAGFERIKIFLNLSYLLGFYCFECVA